jgi:hypothetical protein
VDIPGARTVKARVLSGGQWSALNEADFATPASTLRITEIHYNPAAVVGVVDRQDLEFFEITNTGGQSVNLAGVKIAGFATEPYTFGGGDLGAGARIIVARNPAVFQSVYGAGFNVAPSGYGDSNLSNGGEAVILLGPLGDTLQEFVYSDVSPWPSSPDGGGPSLEIINPLGDASAPSNWRASRYVGGSPGASGIAGDYDGNGAVTVVDWQSWRNSFGQTIARGTLGDGNRDGVVDAADYSVWRDSLAAMSAGAGAIGVQSEVAAAETVASSVAGALEQTLSDEALDGAMAAYFLEPFDSQDQSNRSRSITPTQPATGNSARDAALLLALRVGRAVGGNGFPVIEDFCAEAAQEEEREMLFSMPSVQNAWAAGEFPAN